MTIVNVYLTYNGNCEKAFEFYRSAFGGDFRVISRYKDMPPQEGMPPLSAEMGEMIMHISLQISEETMLMGSDAGGEWAATYNAGNNFSISIVTDQRNEAERLFNSLSEGGNITMPLSDTFWGDYFGMFTDKFGVNWMVSFNANQHQN